MSKYIGDVSAYAYAVSKGYTGTEEEFAELMASYASVAQSAAASATAAAGSATSAASSASTASAAATTATTKASEASTSATNAAGSASSAASSATAASGSATSAAASATTASGKASEAATAATTATTAKTDAVAAKTAAETAQTAAETAQGLAEDAQAAAEDAAESVSASAAQIATNTADITELKEDLTPITDNIIFVKNLVTSYKQGYVSVPTTGSVMIEVENSSYGYVKIKVEPGMVVSSTRPFSVNLSYFVDADNKSLGTINGHTSGNTITVIDGCEWIHLANAWGSYSSLDIVVLETASAITQADGYTVANYPYDTVVSVNIPNLIFGTRGQTANARLTALESFRTASEEIINQSADVVDNIKVYKNLVNNVQYGYYPNVSQGKVVISPATGYGYTKMPVEAGKTYTCSKNGFNGNFARVADANDNNLGKLNEFRVGTTGYIYAMPQNAKYVYGGFNGFTTSYDIVFIEGSDDITSYSTAQYPYNKAYSLEIPLLSGVPHVFRVGSTREYTTLKAGIEEATKYFDSVVYVDAETYDMETEFGIDFFTNYTSSSSRGIQLKNRVHVIFASGAKVVFDGSDYGDAVHQYFSPFNFGGSGGFTLENAWIETKGCRYCVHDDNGNDTTPYQNKYLHCHFEHDSTGTTWGAHQAIGGGFGMHGDVEIRDCYIKSESITYPLTYHNAGYNNSSIVDYKSRITVEGCYIVGSLLVSKTGYGTLVTEAFVSSNSVTAEPGIGATTQDAEDNVVMYKWNNVIRT